MSTKFGLFFQSRKLMAHIRTVQGQHSCLCQPLPQLGCRWVHALILKIFWPPPPLLSMQKTFFRPPPLSIHTQRNLPPSIWVYTHNFFFQKRTKKRHRDYSAFSFKLSPIHKYCTDLVPFDSILWKKKESIELEINLGNKRNEDQRDPPMSMHTQSFLTPPLRIWV